MPNESQKEEGIYDKIIIVLNDKKEYSIINTKLNITVQSGIKDPDTALAIKKAYFMGYYDAKHQ